MEKMGGTQWYIYVLVGLSFFTVGVGGFLVNVYQPNLVKKFLPVFTLNTYVLQACFTKPKSLLWKPVQATGQLLIYLRLISVLNWTCHVYYLKLDLFYVLNFANKIFLVQIGVAYGILSALFCKYTCRNLFYFEPIWIFSSVYLSFLSAQIVSWSGIMAIIGCGLTHKRYPLGLVRVPEVDLFVIKVLN